MQKLGALNENPLPSTSYLPATPSMVPSSSYIPSSEAQPGWTHSFVLSAHCSVFIHVLVPADYYVNLTIPFLCQPPVKRTLAVQDGTRCSRLANQRSRQQWALAPPPPPYQDSTNRGHPCTTQATQQTLQPQRPPARRSPPPPATGLQQLRLPASRRPPLSPQPPLKPRLQHQPLRHHSLSPKRISRSR